MNIQLHHVVSDITGVTGMRIVRAIAAGNDNPAVLASYRDIRCKASVETIQEALTGHYRPEHMFALRQALELYDSYQEKVAECDKAIEAVLAACEQADPSACRFNGRILLVILLQRSRSTFSRRSFPSFFAFKEGIWGTPSSVLGG
jgi:hypothetical protein